MDLLVLSVSLSYYSDENIHVFESISTKSKNESIVISI